MNKYLILLYFFLCCTSCVTNYNTITYEEKSNDVNSLEIHEGIVIKTAQKIYYKKEGKRIATIELSEPVKVVQAQEDEKWGYYQFPGIGKSKDGILVVSWQMKDDSYETYGKPLTRRYTPMMSKDNGLTWAPQDKNYDLYYQGYNVILKNGDELYITSRESKDINSYNSFPDALLEKGSMLYYLEESLPEELKGVYLVKYDHAGHSQNIHANIEDPGLLRYAINNYMPIVWWGNIKQLSDESLITGVYPGNYINTDSSYSLDGVSFYRSTDYGKNWKIQGKIPFYADGISNIRGDKEFVEPTFEVLSDSSMLCVMRSGSTSPLYRSFSKDLGRTWTIPEPITPNGVKPFLFTLDNGVLVLVSGRPGIQIRFSFDGTGQTWSTPIDMLSFMKADGAFIRDVSCGYASVIETSDNSFYIVYSDFTTCNDKGEIRKTIWCRKVSIRI